MTPKENVAKIFRIDVIQTNIYVAVNFALLQVCT